MFSMFREYPTISMLVFAFELALIAGAIIFAFATWHAVRRFRMPALLPVWALGSVLAAGLAALGGLRVLDHYGFPAELDMARPLFEVALPPCAVAFGVVSLIVARHARKRYAAFGWTLTGNAAIGSLVALMLVVVANA